MIENISAKFTKLNKLETSKLATLRHKEILVPTVVPLLAKSLACWTFAAIEAVYVGNKPIDKFCVSKREF